jgi:hypothetical protein
MARQHVRSKRGEWSSHDREFWKRQALNPNVLPLAHRIYALAYGCHNANGHTPLGPGELKRLMCRPPTDSGRARFYDDSTVYRAIQDAVRFGYLDARSSRSCLIVPQGQIMFGIGDRFAPCEVCQRDLAASAARALTK